MLQIFVYSCKVEGENFKMEFVPIKEGQDYILGFGKYKGRNIEDVYNEDPSYLQWVYDNMDLSAQQMLIIENLISTGCPF